MIEWSEMHLAIQDGGLRRVLMHRGARLGRGIADQRCMRYFGPT